MRLINTRTLELHEFFDHCVPSYAIVSHTWGDEEITLQDWLYIRNQDLSRRGLVQDRDEINLLESRAGYSKIINACREAQSEGHEWILAIKRGAITSA